MKNLLVHVLVKFAQNSGYIRMKTSIRKHENPLIPKLWSIPINTEK